MYHYADGVRATMIWHEKSIHEIDSRTVLHRSILQHESLGDRRSVAWVRYNLAWLVLYHKNYAEAIRLYHESLRGFEELGEEDGIIWCHIFLAACAIMQTLRHLSGLVEIFWRRDNPTLALALALFIEQHPTTWDDTRARTMPFIAHLKTQVSAETLAAAQAQARRWTLATCVAELLQL